MKEIDHEEVARKYNGLTEIWDKEDYWNQHTYGMISRFVGTSYAKIKADNFKGKILNAGSAGNNYGLPEDDTTHLDLAYERIKHLPNGLVGNIEDLPFEKNQFQLIVCVGSVINYCDPYRVFEEFHRVLGPDGYVLLEFENSNTVELIGSRKFNKKVVFAESFYNQRKENIWYFSEKFIEEIALEYGMRLVRKDRCHIISPLIYRITKSEAFSAKFARLDMLLKRIPFINRVSSNTVLLLQRRSFD